MATKQAGIKLTLDAGGFRKGLRDTEGEARQSGSRMGKAFSSAFSDGAKGAKDALRSTFSTIKSTMMGLGGLAGGIGFAELTRGAIMTEATFRRLSGRIKDGSGQIVSFRDLQRDARKAAIEWGQSTEELGKVMDDVFTETGNAEFTRKAIEKIATAATGAQQPVETMGKIAGTLNEKFGVTEEQIGDTLASVVALSSKGGLSIEDMGEKLGLIGAVAKEAGFEGKAGFEQMVALMNIADNSTGNLKKGVSAVEGILTSLGTKAERSKTLLKLGIDPSSVKGDVTKTIQDIVNRTGGSKDKLAVAFQGEQLKVIADLGKTYAATFAQTEGDVRTKTRAAVDELERAMREAGKSSLTWAELQKRAADEMQSPEKQIQVGIEKLKEAIAAPEVIDAMKSLISHIPALAEVIASLVGFAAKNPLAAGGLAVGAVAAKGFGEAAISSLIMSAFSRGASSAAPTLTGAIARGASGLAGGFSSAMLGPVGLAIGAAMAIAFLAKAKSEQEEAEKDAAADKGTQYEEGGGGDEGNAGGSGSYMFRRNPATGVIERVNADDLEPGAFDAEKERREAASNQNAIEAAQAFLAPASDEELASVRAQYAPGPSDKGKGETQAFNAEQQAIMRAMMDTLKGKLRVEVTNPEAIRGGPGAGPGGAPLPGHVDRP